MKLLFFLLLLSFFGNKPSENKIIYRPLSWSDYRGKVPENQLQVAARTCTQMELERTWDDDRYTFKVRCYFLPDSSFVRVKKDHILWHEQTHFLIAHIMALRCMQALESLQHGDSLALKEAEKIFHAFTRKDEDQNDLFDIDTNHGLDAEKERLYELSYQKELYGLQKFQK